MRQCPIQNIIFDLGGVLLDLDFEAPVHAFQKLNRNGVFTDVKQFLHNPVFIDLETGSITPGIFRHRVRLMLNNHEAADQEIDHAWCSILMNVPGDRVRMLRQLANRYRLFLYSNTNAIHIPRFTSDFSVQHGIQWESLFEKIFYSHEINDRKPNLSGFRKVLDLAGLDSGTTLFVDDSEVNIAAAARSGLHVMLVRPGDNLQERLDNLLASWPPAETLPGRQ